MNHAIALLVAVVPFILGCSDGDNLLEKSRNDDVATVSSDDPYMREAFARARATLPEFLALAANPVPGKEGFSVKVAVTDGKHTEYFWILPFAADGDAFTGELSNAPRMVFKYSQGEKIRFSRSDIVDWTYQDVDAGKMRGNFTACAMLRHESPENAAAFQAEYGLDCDFQTRIEG